MKKITSVSVLFARPKSWKVKMLAWSRSFFSESIVYITKQKEVVKRFVKAYFCFWNRELLFLHIMAFLLSAMVLFVVVAIFDMRLWMMVKILFFTTLIHLSVSGILRLIYIEPLYDGEYFCQVLLVNGKPKVLTSPIWEKGIHYVIEKFNYSSDAAIFKFNINCYYENVTLPLPLTITMHLEREFDKLELFNALLVEQKGKKVLSLNNYVSNLLSIDQKLNTLVGEYVRQEISCPDFLSQALDFVRFPKKPFSNVKKNVTLCLTEPKDFCASVCR